jgi:hypothetical protein
MFLLYDGINVLRESRSIAVRDFEGCLAPMKLGARRSFHKMILQWFEKQVSIARGKNKHFPLKPPHYSSLE